MADNATSSSGCVDVAKSIVVFDVKPWDTETNLEELEKNIRSIVIDGLIWGTAQRIPVAYGLIKLRIGCIIEDDKVSVDSVEDSIMQFENDVQSVDIVSFQKA